MELIIFKIIVSSAVLVAFYYLFLRKDRSFLFNRIYLLTSLVFAYIIPFIQFDPLFKKNSTAHLIFGETAPNFQKADLPVHENFDFLFNLFWIYAAVSGIFLIKFLYSLSRILLIKGEKRIYQNQKLVITNKKIASFSFLNTIYISRNNFINNEVDARIFLHEKCHIAEKHSLDILFIEILRIFSWFNPALYFYKNVMISNHEYLADAYVLKNDFNISSYQHLILNEIKSSQRFSLTHQFNFNNTKKRFIMMTSKNSRSAGLKKIVLLPVLVVLFVSFTKEKDAQIASPPAENQVTKLKSSVIKGKDFQSSTENSRSPEVKTAMKNDTIKKETTMAAENALQIPPPPVPTPIPAETVDTLPVYPGGLNEFRTLVSKNFDTSVLSEQVGLMKSTVYFTIDENGKVSDFRSEGENAKFNEEALRSIKFSNQKSLWKPATKDGQNVKYDFKMPLTMSFAGSAEK